MARLFECLAGRMNCAPLPSSAQPPSIRTPHLFHPPAIHPKPTPNRSVSRPASSTHPNRRPPFPWSPLHTYSCRIALLAPHPRERPHCFAGAKSSRAKDLSRDCPLLHLEHLLLLLLDVNLLGRPARLGRPVAANPVAVVAHPLRAHLKDIPRSRASEGGRGVESCPSTGDATSGDASASAGDAPVVDEAGGDEPAPRRRAGTPLGLGLEPRHRIDRLRLVPITRPLDADLVAGQHDGAIGESGAHGALEAEHLAEGVLVAVRYLKFVPSRPIRALCKA
eukprot:scaffold24159_cov117-Isochrysis_galbana.AAC.7